MNWNDRLALLNASLNALSFLTLLRGWFYIRRGDREKHRKTMLLAFGISAVFLTSYLTRVAIGGTHPYPPAAPARNAYLVMLTSHVLLAITVPFFAVRGIWLATKGRIEEHRQLMRLGLPVWLYVSVTGVAVYLWLYSAMGRLPG